MVHVPYQHVLTKERVKIRLVEVRAAVFQKQKERSFETGCLCCRVLLVRSTEASREED